MEGKLTIGIIGLGYVGLPLARLFVEKGFYVYGIDIDAKKISALESHKSYLSEFSNAEIRGMFSKGNFSVSSSFERIANSDVVIICVPTPLDEQAEPDLSYVKSAIHSFLPYLRIGQLVVLESSTYPGTTEEELLPLLETSKLKVGKDISLVYSPERIDPGQPATDLSKIPKVLGGMTPHCAQYGKRVYESIFDQVVLVSSPKVAEMTKIVENCQRLVNISFINELAMLCDQMNIDIWEVIAAASTKPYGFMPYYPGPGVGGHCIPVDPLYLLWKARALQSDLKFIELSHQINEQMPAFVVQKVENALPKPLKDCKILAIGVTYKKDVNDIRESRALTVIEELTERGATVNFYDPHIEQVMINSQQLKRISLTKRNVQQHDCTLILTDHTGLPYQSIVSAAALVIDTRNATQYCKNNGNVILL